MKVKIELFEVLAYVPYDVKVNYRDYTASVHDYEMILEQDAKLVLYPIDKIFTIPEISDEFTYHQKKVFASAIFDNGNLADYLTLKQAQLCFKNHVDIFDLIMRGLAVEKK